MSATFQITPEMRKAKQRENAAKYVLYWPGDQWFHGEYGGNGYWIPPDLNGKMVPHPAFRENGVPVMVKADGTYVVRDFYGVIYGKKAVPSEGVWKRPILDRDGKIDSHTADLVVEHFTKGDHGRLGLTELTGDPEMDTMIRTEAKKKNLDANKEWAQNELNARREFLDKFKKENPGVNSFPPPKESQIRAEIVMLRLSTANVSKALYKCECGMFEHDEFELYKMHQEARHGKTIDAPELKAPEAEPDMATLVASGVVIDNEVEPVKRGPGRPKKVVTEG